MLRRRLGAGPGGGRIFEHDAETLEHARGGAQLLGLHALQRRLPAPLPGGALGLDLAPALRGQAGDDHATIGLRARPLDVTAVGEVLEHLRDRRGRQPCRARELSGRELAALVQLDQQLELGMADLRAPKMGVASRAGG